ncbi:hypothetical protein BRC96_01120 [Halobacteriales archaeon QS_6_64_34]|nr:MAG: hypothetical protein BRC96_01120 [Halobacteriales archaeon QS_6_64_34]
MLYADSKIALSDEIPDRTASIVEDVFATLGETVTPTTLRLGISSLPAQTPIPAAKEQAELLPDSPLTVSNPDKVTFGDYTDRLAEIPVDDGRIVQNSKVTTDATKVRIFLRSGMQTIDSSGSTYYEREQPTVEDSLNYAPLVLTIIHFGPKYGPEDKLEGDSLYRISISTGSDIWFDDTQIARINRARLHELLHRIDSVLPVVKRKFSVGEMSGYINADAEAVFDYDGPPAEELIREYRIDWVKSELVETAAQYEEDGNTVFEVTSDAESITTDELRKRIEAYVDQQQTKGNAPQADILRIIRTDGTPLEARFSDGDIEWIDDEADQR